MHFKKKKRYANENQNTSLFQKKLNHYILDKTDDIIKMIQLIRINSVSQKNI